MTYVVSIMASLIVWQVCALYVYRDIVKTQRQTIRILKYRLGEGSFSGEDA